MKKIYLIFILSLLCFSALCEAQEPINLVVAKQRVKQYHDSGEYNKDIKNVINQAMRYLKIYQSRHLHTQKKPAIVLDIDETTLSNYSDIAKRDFGGTMDAFRKDMVKGTDPAIEPMLKLYRYAKSNNIAVFFITGRMEDKRSITIANLENAGYHDWDGLTLRKGKFQTAPAAVYKTAKRKELTEQGYDIILNIGDQKSDLRGGYADKRFKLPNPYYLIP